MEKEELWKDLPKSPGVYIMKNKKGAILYIGKAKDLRARVRSYFDPAHDTRYRIRFLVPKIDKVDFVVTDTEKEALILENTLIKKHKPRYNVLLRDDKTYISLRIDPRESFPRLNFVRKVARDGALYFGPYTSAHAARDTYRSIHQLFPLRSCSDSVFRTRRRPCLQYQINRCAAPCVGLISKEEYKSIVKQVIMFLEGRSSELIKVLEERMKEEAEALRFEEAARLRDKIAHIRTTIERQKMVCHGGEDEDVFALYREDHHAEIALMIIRGGALVERSNFSFSDAIQTDEDLLSSAIRQYYELGRYIPDAILVSHRLSDATLLEEYLSDLKGDRVQLKHPQKGEKKALVDLAIKNAMETLRLREDKQAEIARALEEIAHKFRLKEPPKRIECFDISDIMGQMAVGSMTVMIDGEIAKDNYRRYRIKSAGQADDYSMMREVLTRRLADKPERSPLPDLLIVDGGKGQLKVATEVLKEAGLLRIPAVGMAKARKATGKEEERFYLPNRKNHITFPRNSLALRLLMMLRNEAHRFAIEYHRKLRSKAQTKSILEEIPGIGSKRKKALLTHFGSLKKIKEASPEELQKAPMMNRELAERIALFFRQLQETNLRETD